MSSQLSSTPPTQVTSPTASTGLPVTPPNKKGKSQVRTPGLAHDSGVEDVFDSPAPKTSISAATSFAGRNEEQESDGEPRSDEELDAADHEGGEEKVLAENPFDNEQSRILFDAIDKLQSWGSSKFLKIPQLVVVGGQSTGKSSLLRSLTDIPFPVGDGCCTQFPIRVVSRRTAPDCGDSFRIAVEDPEMQVEGLELADREGREFEVSGGVLTAELFDETLTKLWKLMGIRRGCGPDKKNYVSNLVKVELSGPNRAPFSILDLPGLVSSPYNMNAEEMEGIKDMAVKYMKRSENIVICVASAASDLGNQGTYSLALEYAGDHDRLVRVFTQCDKATSAGNIVEIANGKVEEGERTFEDGFFVVSNPSPKDIAPSDRGSWESQLFGRAPWTKIDARRRGTPTLKKHLAKLLSSRIGEEFPSLEESIKEQLAHRIDEQVGMGEPREEHSARQAYLNRYVQKYREMCNLALTRPGHLDVASLEMRQQARTLNDQFDRIMRVVGGTWTFQDTDLDPAVIMAALREALDSPILDEGSRDAKRTEILKIEELTPEQCADAVANVPGYDQHKKLKDVDDFGVEVTKYLHRFQASQPPEVVNSDIYPVIYRLQVKKWNSIAEELLGMIKRAMRGSFEGILNSVCPPSGGTAILHNELKRRLEDKFSNTFQESLQRTREYSNQEKERTMLQTTDPSFGVRLSQWRWLRYARNQLQCQKREKNNPFEKASAKLDNSFETMTLKASWNMAFDVHDVVKVYYEISREAFIRHITQTIVENFVMHKDGPLHLPENYVLNLSEKEVEEMAREDAETIKRRAELSDEIENLKKAHDIAQEAREKIRRLVTG